MDSKNENDHVFNIKLAKLIGLYQLLDPETVKYRGRNIHHIFMACALIFMCLTTMILIISGLYFWTVNIPISMDYFWKSVMASYAIYKAFIIICYSNDIWNCLSITRYDFTSFSDRNRLILDRWRERLSWLTNIFSIIYFTACMSYFVITLPFSENKLPVKNHAGSIAYYRQNAVNLYLIVSDETYNTHYYTFYFVEVVFTFMLSYSTFIFDIILITLCFGVCCQMKVIYSEFESVGHKSLRDRHSPIDYTVENINIPQNEHDLIYDKLKTIIMDHQAVIKIYEAILTLIRRVILLHIFISSLSVILILFTFIMSFFNLDIFRTSDVIVKKMLCLIPAILFQIYMVCYLFGILHNQKDSITYALYSSNWTEMDMKCKKLILLTMKLNNANQKKLKFTRTKIVNLEMFFKTMSNCYTVISVLVNHILKKDE